MNVLLANMPTRFNQRENLEPPLGICYLAAMFKDANGVNVRLRDYEVATFSDDKLKDDLSDLDILGVSFRTASYKCAKEYIQRAKDLQPELFVVAGGHHATAFPRQTLLDMGSDAVVVGEGEYTFRELVERRIRGASLEGLRGVVYKRTDSVIVNNGPASPVHDIDRLPWPARELLDLDQYTLATILTSRGCPFNCIYCDKGVSTRKVKFRSSESILEEMRHIVKSFRKTRLYIVDDHFFLNRKRVQLILDSIIEEKLPLTWVCQARADGVSEDLLIKAKRAGCEQIIYGIETGDETILKYIRKKSTLSDAQSAIALTKKAGITARANFMLGFPVSTRDTMRNTIQFARRIDPDIARFFVVSPLPNTDLWDHIYGKGNIPSDMNWDQIDLFSPSFDIEGFPRDEIPLYTAVAYWHVSKRHLLRESTIGLLPNLFKLLSLAVRTRRIRGNLTKCFPKTVNLLLGLRQQVKGMHLLDTLRFLRGVLSCEKKLQAH